MNDERWSWTPTAKDLAAVDLLREGDASIEGRRTQGHDQPGGAIINTLTAERLQHFGWAESYEVGRISPRWMLRITEAARVRTVPHPPAIADGSRS